MFYAISQKQAVYASFTKTKLELVSSHDTGILMNSL